jgi:hypothetical protein
MGLMAVFAGPDDSDTCDEPNGGCDEAVDGNPYDIDEVPQPGDFACMGNCRHIVQLIGDDESQDGETFTYVGSVGFVENPAIADDGTAVVVDDASDSTDEDTITPDAQAKKDEDDRDKRASFFLKGIKADEEEDRQESTPTDPDEDEDVLNPANALFDDVPSIDDWAEIVGDDADSLAQWSFESGIDPQMVIISLGLNDTEAADLLASYDGILGDGLDKDYAMRLLSDGNVEQLTELAKQSPDFAQLLKQMATEGFEDSKATYAYFVAEAIGGVAKLDPDDGLWTVAFRESLVEGGAGSGDHGHAGRKGQRGGSAPPNKASLVKHILAHYEASNAQEKQYGKHWYEAAHTFALGLAHKYSLTLKQSAGIIAALSPQTSWARNMTMAEEMAQTGKTRGLGVSIQKAQDIRNGKDPDDVVTANKTNSFYHNILDPKNDDHVTIDRHAVALAIGPSSRYDIGSLDNVGHYQAFVDAYKEAAQQMGMRPHEMQSTTWLHYRDGLDRTPSKDALKFKETLVWEADGIFADLIEGGAGSGDHAHAGRKGLRGGSAKTYETVLSKTEGAYKVSTRAQDLAPRAIAMGYTAKDIATQYNYVPMPKSMQIRFQAAVDANLEAVPAQAKYLKTIVSSDEQETFLQGKSQGIQSGWDASTSIGADGKAVIAMSPKHMIDDWKNIVQPQQSGGTIADDIHPATFKEYATEAVTHEMGHVFELSQPKAFQAKVEEIYKANPSGVSQYGATNAHEYFAEAYAAYMTGHGDTLLPNSIHMLMEDTFGKTARVKEAEAATTLSDVLSINCDFINGKSTITYRDGTKTTDHKPMREGGEGSGDHGHAGRVGQVGGSAAGVHVLKVSEEPGMHIIKFPGSTDFLNYRGFPTDTRLKNTILQEIDKNIDLIPGQPPKIGEVFFTDMAEYQQGSTTRELPTTVGMTLNRIDPSVVGFHTANIVQHDLSSADIYSLADYAKSTSEYARLAVDHEMGHVLWNNTSPANRIQFIAAYNKYHEGLKPDFFTRYASTSLREGFAEAYAAYVNKMPLPDEYSTSLKAMIGEHRLQEAVAESTDEPIAYFCGFGKGPTYHVYSDHTETFAAPMREGGPGSGDHGHAGRKGQVGGSSAGIDTDIKALYNRMGPERGPATLEAIERKYGTRLDTFIKDQESARQPFEGVLYHASADSAHAVGVTQGTEKFYNDEKTNAFYGPGLYFAANPRDTDDYGENVLAAKVKGSFLTIHNTEYNDDLESVARIAHLTSEADVDTETSDNQLAQILFSYKLQQAGYDGIKIIDPYGGGTRGGFVADFNAGKTVGKVATPAAMMHEADADDHSLFVVFNQKAISNVIKVLREGGAGSGNFGHAGRTGEVGGSAATATPKVATPVPGAEEFKGPIAPWDMKADAPPRYPGDTSIYSPALPDANGNYPLGRRLQGVLTGKDPGKEGVMYTFIPGNASPDQLAKFEHIIESNSDHAQLHPGEIAFNDNGTLTKIPGNNYWVRGNYKDLEALDQQLTPQVKAAFGDKSAWSLMMTPETPDGTKMTVGEPTTHLRVVVPFEKGTPENTVGTPIMPPEDRDKVMSVMSGDEGRRVWQHTDFNGMHIATDIPFADKDYYRAAIRELGGQEETAADHQDQHNAGATRFIPKDVNIEDYPVRTMSEGMIRVKPRMIRVMREANPNQARDEHGKWTSGGGEATSIAQRTVKGQGGSFSTHGEGMPKTGYMVAEDGHERAVEVDSKSFESIRDAVASYMKDKATDLKRPGVYLGTWLENGTLYMDNSHNILDRSTAFQFSHDNNQLAVYNVNNGIVENTMQDGKRPSESTAKITESIQESIDKPKHKIFFDPKTATADDIAKKLME